MQRPTTTVYSCSGSSPVARASTPLVSSSAVRVKFPPLTLVTKYSGSSLVVASPPLLLVRVRDGEWPPGPEWCIVDRVLETVIVAVANVELLNRKVKLPPHAVRPLGEETLVRIGPASAAAAGYQRPVRRSLSAGNATADAGGEGAGVGGSIGHHRFPVFLPHSSQAAFDLVVLQWFLQ